MWILNYAHPKPNNMHNPNLKDYQITGLLIECQFDNDQKVLIPYSSHNINMLEAKPSDTYQRCIRQVVQSTSHHPDDTNDDLGTYFKERTEA